MANPSKSTVRPGGLRVEPVRSRAEKRRFFELAGRVQGGDRHWVEPLRIERRRQWSARNPWFEHATAERFLAHYNGRPVGTISAQIDRLHPPEDGRRVGYFGQFESIDSRAVTEALLDTAAGWLAASGCGLMRGPFDLGINQSCGLLVEGFEDPPMVMMNHAPPFYAERIADAGMRPCMDLLAYLMPPDFPAPAPMQRLLERAGRRVRLRPMDFSKWAAEIDLLRDIFNDAWARNWGFVGLTEPEFRAMGQELRQIIRPGYTAIAEVDGEAAGFIVALPNINELIRDLDGRLLPTGWMRLLWRIKRRRARTARVPLMGVRQKFQRGPQGAAISFGMIDRVRGALAEDGIRQVELSWILETNQGMKSLIESMGGRLYKRYRLFERDLST